MFGVPDPESAPAVSGLLADVAKKGGIGTLARNSASSPSAVLGVDFDSGGVDCSDISEW